MQSGKHGVRAEMNVTPLIDILLVLLIIFMVITPIMLLQHRVDIPKKAEVDMPPEITTDQVVLTYTKDNVTFLNQNRVERMMLAKRIKEIYQNRRDKTMFLNIDPNANYGEALKLIDSVRASGVEKLAVITLKEGEKFQIPGGVEPLAPSSP